MSDTTHHMSSLVPLCVIHWLRRQTSPRTLPRYLCLVNLRSWYKFTTTGNTSTGSKGAVQDSVPRASVLESKCTTSAAKRIPERAATMWTFPPGYPAPGQGGYPPMPPGQVRERLRAPLVCLSLPHIHLSAPCRRRRDQRAECMYPRDWLWCYNLLALLLCAGLPSDAAGASIHVETWSKSVRGALPCCMREYACLPASACAWHDFL